LLLIASLVAVLVGGPTGEREDLRLAAAPSPERGPVTISTVPAVADFPVVLDGVTRFTDAAGNAHFDATANRRTLSDRITLTEADLSIGGQPVRVRATRFYQFDGNPQLALAVSYLVSFRFSGKGGAPLDGTTIKTITVKSETGEVVELPANQSSWLQGIRAAPRRAFLVGKTVGWRVQQVRYRGSNVVNIAQQRFAPAEQQDVPVDLLFFGLQLQVRDAMFGFSHGGAVKLIYPDGHSRHFPLDQAGRLNLPSLPRGDYTLTVLGAGPEMSRSLAVSRDQQSDLDFYSWLDILTVLGVLLGALVGLAWWGRARRRRQRAHEHRPERTATVRRRRQPGRHSQAAARAAVLGDRAAVLGDRAAG